MSVWLIDFGHWSLLTGSLIAFSLCKTSDNFEKYDIGIVLKLFQAIYYQLRAVLVKRDVTRQESEVIKMCIAECGVP